jgi:hypothetical protein
VQKYPIKKIIAEIRLPTVIPGGIRRAFANTNNGTAKPNINASKTAIDNIKKDTPK